MLRIRTATEILKAVPGARTLFRLPGLRLLKDGIGAAIDTFDIRRMPDRRYFADHIIPELARNATGPLLTVGCRSYSAEYGAMWQKLGVDVWTIDFDPAAAKWGVPGQHIIGDMLELDKHFTPAFFSVVILNGVFGFGVDREDQMDRAVDQVWKVLRPNGLLLVGWNADKTGDPELLDAMTRQFRRAGISGLPERKTFSGATHVYDTYARLG